MNKKWKSYFMKCSLAFTLIFSMLVPLDITYAGSEATTPVIQQAARQEFTIFKRTKPNSKSVSIGNKLLNNELYINNIWPTYTFTGPLTWKENPYKDSTWCLYFQV